MDNAGVIDTKYIRMFIQNTFQDYFTGSQQSHDCASEATQ